MSEIQTKPAGWRSAYAQSKFLAALELLLLAALLSLQFMNFGIQISPTVMVLGWLSLLLRRTGWKGIGMSKPEMGWTRTLIWGVVGGVLADSLSTWVVGPAVHHFTGSVPDFSSFRALTGNLGRTLMMLTIGWTFAAVGEEIIFRGYMCNRLTDVIGKNRAGWVLALVFSSAFFGSLHSYQGVSGVIDTGVAGALFGLGYYLSGRNLWVAILMHGIADTIGVTKFYLGIFPS